jgi:hypothetical protein
MYLSTWGTDGWKIIWQIADMSGCLWSGKKDILLLSGIQTGRLVKENKYHSGKLPETLLKK